MFEKGGVSWLAKPIHMRSLVRAVSKVLAKAPQGMQLKVLPSE
jgi:hypothetical protein